MISMSGVDMDDNKTARDFTIDQEKSVRVADWRDNGLWIIILSMGGRNFCVYIGVPIDHPLAGYDYDNLPVDCHGGLTFSGKGDGKYRPEGYYWYGWDYGHSGDFTYYGDGTKPMDNEQDWTLKQVKGDAWNAVYEMGKLKDLAEKIYSKARSGDE